MEYVYIFDFGDKIKAGYSTCVEKRLRTIELSSGVKARQVYSVNAGRKEEKLLHSCLDNRMEGEFFSVSYDEAKDILDKIIRGEITAPPTRKYGKDNGTVRYKIDILAALKEQGFTTYKLRTERLMGESTIQQLRKNELVSWANIARICDMLECQPGDILEYEKEAE